MWPRYLRCKHCLIHVRVEVLSKTFGSQACEFCPACGRQATVQWDRDLDIWYTLAEGFGFQPNEAGVALTKNLYELWDPAEHNNFGDFVRDSLGNR